MSTKTFMIKSSGLYESKRCGFTVIELLFVIGIIIVLLGLLLPAVRTSTGVSRSMTCSNHFKQLGLAVHNYHSAYDQLPTAMGGTGVAASDLHGNSDRLNGLVALLPFIEEQALWEQISNPSEFNGIEYPPMGPAPWVAIYEPWKTEVVTLRCVSDPPSRSTFGRSNYVFCIGDIARSIHTPKVPRGIFACRLITRFKDVTDGLANTIAMAEIGTASDRSPIGQYAIDQPESMLDDPKQCRSLVDDLRPNFYAPFVSLSEHGRGVRWADGAAGFGLMNTILPPNSPSIAVGGSEAVDGIYSATSHHQGGTHLLMGDGAVKFVTDNIDTGNQSHPTFSAEQLVDEPQESPYGLWGRRHSRGARAARRRFLLRTLKDFYASKCAVLPMSRSIQQILAEDKCRRLDKWTCTNA